MRIMKASAQKLGGELTLSPPSGGSGFSVSVRFAPSVGTGCGTP
jgi:nitrate/nitrite-specific signal transduction histidine kinase